MDDLTNGGSYTGSASPYGTFDQGGNIFEWNEAISGTSRVLRGGNFTNTPGANLSAALGRTGDDPSSEYGPRGFRLASIPEPSTGLLVIAGLFGLGWRRARENG